MLRNFFVLAFRHLSRNKMYVFINTLGMGIAMACCMAAYLLLAYNIEFDDYFEQDDVKNIVKVIHHRETVTGKDDPTLVCPLAIGPLASREMAGIETFSRFYNEDGIVSYGDNAFHENIRFADASFFNMFPIGLSRGAHKNFNDQQSIFLSSALAKKYFADTDPVGETMNVEINGIIQQVVVGGVLETLPLNISFHIDALMRIEKFLDSHKIVSDELDADYSASVLLKLNDINQRAPVGKQLGKYVKLINLDQKEIRTTSFELVPFSTPVVNGEVSESDLRLPIPTIALIIFSVLAAMILLIACFNLTNTTIALAGERLREIGVRKVVGSRRRQIVAQFLIEMLITVFFALAAGLIIAQFIVPQFARMWQLQYGLHDLNMLNLIVALSVLLFVTALLAGAYPALLNSRYNPIELLKGKTRIAGKSFLSKSLMVIQFSLSVMVLIAGLVFTQNATYQKELGLGYDHKKLLIVNVLDEQEYSRFKNKINTNPKIERIAGAANSIGPYTARKATIRIDTTSSRTILYKVGADYLETVGLPVIHGRDFIEANSLDYESTILVDENFVVNHQLKNPLETQLIYDEKPYRIIGVVGNHLSGFKHGSDADHVYTLVSQKAFSTLIVRADESDLNGINKQLEKDWKSLFPGRPFESNLQKEIVYEEANEYNVNLRQIFFFMTLLGCLLSSSGIYAMASLNVQRRANEIGVRKVLGASVNNIIRMLSREFAVLLSVAALLGGTGGYFLTNALMNSLYKQHIAIGPVTLIMSGVIVFVIGIASTGGAIFNIAITNPAMTLRND